MARAKSLDEAKEQVWKAITQYAEEQGWQPWDYDLTLRDSQWDSIHIFLAARAFKDDEGFAKRDKEILNYLQRELTRETWDRVGGLLTMSFEKRDRLGLGKGIAESFKRVLDEQGLTLDELFDSWRSDS